jgi:hypothetical protein
VWVPDVKDPSALGTVKEPLPLRYFVESLGSDIVDPHEFPEDT